GSLWRLVLPKDPNLPAYMADLWAGRAWRFYRPRIKEQQRTNTVGNSCVQPGRKRFMNSVINKATVLVLNRNWQAINIRTPAEAFCQMATGVATALEIFGEEHIRPVTWDEWVMLPIREGDKAVHTLRGGIRVPPVIVALDFAKVPTK